MWPVLEPATPLIDNYAIDAVCDHMQAVTRGEIRDLIINIPPRCLKSSMVSVLWPTWEWLQRPDLRYLTASYSMRLAVRDALKSRRIITSDLYKLLNRDKRTDEQRFQLLRDQNQKSRYENDRGGYRIVTSTEASVTGEGGDRVVCDDPSNLIDIYSELKRVKAVTWWDESMSTRRNDPGKSARILIMQRLHLEDLTGVLLSRGEKFEHLCIPLRYEPDHPHRSRTSLHFKDPRTEEGEVLAPQRFTPAVIEDFETTLGTRGWAGQMQQRPVPAEGSILKLHWFQRYDVFPLLAGARVIQSWDCTFGAEEGNRRKVKPKAKRSWVVGQVWAFLGPAAYLLDETRGRWNILETMAQMHRMRSLWPEATKILIENKANGPAIEQQLRSSVPGIQLWEPSGSKAQRVYSIEPFVESGHVYVPSHAIAPWSSDWLGEVTSFPGGTDDDRVDAMSQALISQYVSKSAAAIRQLEKMVA